MQIILNVIFFSVVAWIFWYTASIWIKLNKEDKKQAEKDNNGTNDN